MAKKTRLRDRKIKLLIGIVILLIGLFGFRDLISILLIIAGGYLVWDGMRG